MRGGKKERKGEKGRIDDIFYTKDLQLNYNNNPLLIYSEIRPLNFTHRKTCLVVSLIGL